MPEQERIIIFEPFFSKEFSVNVYNTENIQSFIYAGALEPYATLIDDDPLGGPRMLRMQLSLPETLEPGVYEVMFGGKEYFDVGGTVGALAAVGTRITIISLHPGQYPAFSFFTPEFGVGQKANMTVTIENFGDQDINSAYATIDVIGPEGQLITTLQTNPVEVVSKQKSLIAATSSASFDSSRFNIKPGIYKAIATLSYDGKVYDQKVESTFRVGTLSINVTDSTPIIYANVTNKYQITITSDWASTIDDVYAKIYTPDGTLKTPNLDLSKFQSAQLEAYWETKKTPLGNNTVTVEVFYSGTSVKKDVNVEVVPPIEPVEEKPSLITPINIGILVLVILVLLNLYFFVYKKKDQVNQPIQPPRV